MTTSTTQKRNIKAQHTAPVHHLVEAKSVPDKEFVFMKWFYFTIIATTTIGYGQVYPKTNNGKLFYIFFSIIGKYFLRHIFLYDLFNPIPMGGHMPPSAFGPKSEN